LTREDLEPLVQGDLTLRQIAIELGRSPSTVRHWLKRHGLTTTRQRRLFNGEKPKEIISECRHHGQARFMLEGRNAYRCTRCRSDAVTAWRRRAKRRLIEARGGACERCGYDEHPAALQFHHLEPNLKEFSISNKGGTIAFARLQEEAEKCILVCANCHALLEWGSR
jgi:Homeodomain-like domain-containing protein